MKLNLSLTSCNVYNNTNQRITLVCKTSSKLSMHTKGSDMYYSCDENINIIKDKLTVTSILYNNKVYGINEYSNTTSFIDKCNVLITVMGECIIVTNETLGGSFYLVYKDSAYLNKVSNNREYLFSKEVLNKIKDSNYVEDYYEDESFSEECYSCNCIHLTYNKLERLKDWIKSKIFLLHFYKGKEAGYEENVNKKNNYLSNLPKLKVSLSSNPLNSNKEILIYRL